MQKLYSFIGRLWEQIVAGLITTAIVALFLRVYPVFGDFLGVLHSMTIILNILAWIVFGVGVYVIIYTLIHQIRKRLKKLEVVKDRRFMNQVVVLDGKDFINCIFENCTFVWNGGNFRTDAWRIGGRFYLEFHDPLANTTAKFLDNLGMLVKNPERGTFLIPKDRLEKGMPSQIPIPRTPPTTNQATPKTTNPKLPIKKKKRRT